jgi:hypothetical protein
MTDISDHSSYLRLLRIKRDVRLDTQRADTYLQLGNVTIDDSPVSGFVVWRFNKNSNRASCSPEY